MHKDATQSMTLTESNIVSASQLFLLILLSEPLSKVLPASLLLHMVPALPRDKCSKLTTDSIAPGALTMSSTASSSM